MASSLGASMCLSMRGTSLIGDLMEWVDTKMEEGNELGMEVPELDFILLLSAESDDQLHKELKQQLGDFPYPCDDFEDRIRTQLKEVRQSSPKLNNTNEGFGKPRHDRATFAAS